MATKTDDQKRIAELEAKLKQMEAEKAAGSTFSMKVSEKGGLSVYGLGRYPTTLYKDQWKALLAHKEDILKFIEDNKDKLSSK